MNKDYILQKLSQEKEFTTISIISESTMIVVGSSYGNIYILRLLFLFCFNRFIITF